MRLVIQRVLQASVRSGGEPLGSIERGALVLVGIASGDTSQLVDRMADKLLGIRYFDDPEGRTNLSLADIDGALLVVSQFTLLANVRRGRRPGFAFAASPETAEPLVERLCERLRAAGARVETGRFGASMQVELVNDGPFTLLLDSDRDHGGA